jgi:D-alanyl-D-alanine carboxypeptidase
MQVSTSLCAIALGASLLSGVVARAEPSILFDARTGQVIESEDAFARWYPASLTKLMTTYVAFRMIDAGEVTLQSPIRMTAHAAKEPPSKMGYKPGSILTLDNALKILMVKSANDVAMAVGESLGGSQQAFADRMNAEAARLGMTGTHWVNPHGLHDDNQYTTARDLAILSTALRHEFPQYAAYFSLDGIVAGKSRIPNHNTLIGRFEGADGMKTGYTCPSGFNLVASATRDGRTLMAVVIGSKSVATRAEKAAGMLARGFTAQTMGAPTLRQLKPSGENLTQATNMYDQLCSKEARARIAKEEKERIARDQDEDDAAAQKSIYLSELKQPRNMITVTLGGATGPVPKGVALALAQEEKAGVPLPSWRPDKPLPVGAEPLVQGDGGAR